MSYGLKAANNKMAMARGAKFMKVHNLPGWYNTNNNLFGPVKAPRPVRTYVRNPIFNIPKMINNPVYNTPKAPWVTARQSGVRLFNKKNMKDILKGAIGSNSKGMGWAKYKNDFYPLIGTSKSYGYVINLSKHNAPFKYNSVVKGLKPYKALAPVRIPRLKF